MSDDLITANKNDSFSKVKSLMEEKKIHHIPVVDGEKLIGIISRTDILQYSHSKAFGGDDSFADASLDQNVSIEKLMTKTPKTIKSSDSIKHAVEILNSFSFNSIPVVSSENSNLVGIVTTKDLMNYLVNQY